HDRLAAEARRAAHRAPAGRGARAGLRREVSWRPGIRRVDLARHAGRPFRLAVHRAARAAATGPVKTRAFSRAVTILAVGFLLLDAVLFAVVARYVWAAGCAVAAVLVIYAWRRYRRAMDDLAEARRDMKREAESIRELLHTHYRN